MHSKIFWEICKRLFGGRPLLANWGVVIKMQHVNIDMLHLCFTLIRTIPVVKHIDQSTGHKGHPGQEKPDH